MKRTILASLIVIVSVLTLASSDEDKSYWVKSENNMYASVPGNVGIGLENPEGKLHVSGNAVFDLGSGRIMLGTAGGWPGLVAFSPNGNRRDMCIQDNGIVIATSPSKKAPPYENGIWIAENGNVGIGTLSPRGRLDVNGRICQRGNTLHADYVFEPGYELESIDEHSQFMWRHRHLKAIPKASVTDDGQTIVEVGAHLKGTVEELEKAHIYIEQLHKRIRALEEENAEIVALKQRLVALESLVAGLTSSQGADQH